MYTAAHLANIRLYELDRVSSYLRKGYKVLEIGAGAGWQAKKLSERGVRVTAIDITSSFYKPDQVWPVIEYDGEHIPFPDNYFDIVFSSNVLEHIPHVRLEHADMRYMLQNIGAEDNVKIIVRERNMLAVVFNDRPDLIRFIKAGGNVDRRDAHAALAQFLGLPARAGADFKNFVAFAQVGRDSIELVQSNIGQMCGGIHKCRLDRKS